MQNIDEDTVTESVKTMLDILYREEQMVEADDTHVYQIKEYLSLPDEKFNALSAVQRSRILERILSEIKGRMMEDIVLLETKIANPKKEVFKLQFAVGESDMVIYDRCTLTCEIYEIKYSREVVADQYRYLINAEKCAETEHRFGTITGRYVIYRGEAAESDGVQYLNVEQYLKSLV